MTDSRKTFADLTRNLPPRPLLVEAVELVASKGRAIDLGAGALNESRYLVEQGFEHVLAIDRQPIASDEITRFPSDRFEYLTATFEEFIFPENFFDLANALYSLPFIAPDQFERVFRSIRGSLRVGGIFVGHLFGDRDEWASNMLMTFHSVGPARDLFSGMDLILFDEEEWDGTTARGVPKHWHVFRVIARRN